jgi:choline-glycine betaine transporter
MKTTTAVIIILIMTALISTCVAKNAGKGFQGLERLNVALAQGD